MKKVSSAQHYTWLKGSFWGYKNFKLIIKNPTAKTPQDLNVLKKERVENFLFFVETFYFIQCKATGATNF